MVSFNQCLMMCINFLIWNHRGAGNRQFARLIKDLHYNHHFSILVLLETRVSGARADKISEKIGLDGVFRVDPNGFAGGIWIFWDKNMWQLDILVHNDQVVHMKILGDEGHSWFFSACYGRPQRVTRA